MNRKSTVFTLLSTNSEVNGRRSCGLETWGARQHGDRWLAHKTPNAAALGTGGSALIGRPPGGHQADYQDLQRCGGGRSVRGQGSRSPAATRDEDLVFPR